MMYFVQGKSVFDETFKFDFITIPVNCVGPAGSKGLALEWKNKFPVAYRQYRALCQLAQIRVGYVHEFKHVSGAFQDFYLFPTKDHWRDLSKIEWIDEGLSRMRWAIDRDFLNRPSIAIPALGCGNGGLAWDDVKPLIVEHFSDMAGDVWVFEPGLDG
jgi:hypothetical protein